MITADFGIVPIGSEETDLGEYVSIAVKAIKDSGLDYELTGMGTQIEAESLNELYGAIKTAQEAVFKTGARRIYTVIKIDDRRDKKDRGLQDKIKTVTDIVD